MVTYESKKHQGVFVTSDGVVDPKYKTMTIQFADGKVQSLSIATIKRWWTLVDTSNQVVDDLKNETPDTTIDSEPVVEQTVEKSPKKEKQNKDTGCPEDFVSIITRLAGDNGVKIRTWDSKPRMFAVLNANGKAALELYRGNKTFKVRAREICIPAGIDYALHKHISFNATLDLPYTDKGYKTLETLIKKSIAYTPTKKTRNIKKEEN